MSHETQENNVYQTGNTQPPKNRQGLIAVLLVLVIFLGSLVCCLSLLNVHLFHKLEDTRAEPEDSINFIQNTTPCRNALAELGDGRELQHLGLVVQELSSVYRQYQNLPEGLFIVEVCEDSPAYHAEILIGDILIAVNGITVDENWLNQGCMVASTPDQPMLLTLLRDNEPFTISLDMGG